MQVSVLSRVHRRIRRYDIETAFMKPCFWSAMTAYSEHEGWNRQMHFIRRAYH